MGPYFWSPTNSGSGSQRRTGSAQTCVDVVGQPQVTVVDFTGQTGANYITGTFGKFFILFDKMGQSYAAWFNTTTESAPSAGATFYIEVDISPSSSSFDIAAALESAINGAYPSVFNADQGGSSTTITTVASAIINPSVDGNTGAAITTTQSGYPSGHYCTPTSDALAAFSFLIRPQTQFLGVGAISGLGPGYIPVDPFLSNAQLLFSDAAGTVPANTQGATVENNTDPISGLALVQSNSMNAPTLQFIQNANGLWVPTLAFNGTSDSLATAGNIGITGAQARTVFVVAKYNSLSSTGSMFGFGASDLGLLFAADVRPQSGGIWYFNGYGGGSDVPGSAADTLWHVHCLSYDGTNIGWQIDGLTYIENFPAPVSLNTTDSPLSLGSDGPQMDFFNGNIAAGPIIFAVTLTDSQKTTIFNYLAAPLGIVIS